MKNYRINIIDAIKSINPDAKIRIDSSEKRVATDSDIDICTLEWLEGTTPISKADIKTKLAELKVEYNEKEYQRKRKAEYPSIPDQLDMQYWDGINSTTTWADAIAKVKTENPK